MSSYPHVVVISVTIKPSRHCVASSVSSVAVEERCVCASIVHAECGRTLSARRVQKQGDKFFWFRQFAAVNNRGMREIRWDRIS